MIYEDELADNGMSILSVRIRVMPARLLLLSRFYMRLDDVVFRIRDTRVFVEFSERLVIREYQEREDSYDRVKEVRQSRLLSHENKTTCVLTIEMIPQLV